MNKKILITILTILGLAVVVGGFYLWLQKKADLMHVNVEKRIIENDKQEQGGNEGGRKNKEYDKKNDNKQEKTEDLEAQMIPRLSPKEIEKLKKEKDLVWYEIPELGIKFLVTKDTKEDLRYDYKTYKGYNTPKGDYLDVKSIMLFSKSETDKNLSGCTLDEEKGWSCGWIDMLFLKKSQVILYASKNYKKNWTQIKWCDSLKNMAINNYLVCANVTLSSIQSYTINNTNYRKLFHIQNQNNKTFGIYLNTIQPIK